MKMLKKIVIGFVCLSLMFTLGCNKTAKTKTSSTNSNSTSTAKKTSNTPAGGIATTATILTSATNTGNPSLTSGTAPTATTSTKQTRTGPFDGGFSSDQPLVYSLANITSSAPIPILLSDTIPSVAGQFFATTNFDYIETGCPSCNDNIGNLTLSIYNWNDNYEATVSGQAIKSQEFANYVDNAFLQIKFDNPLPAGEYLWVLSNPVDTVGIWSYAEGPENHGSDVKCYVSGELCETFHLCKIEYTKTPNITLVELSK